MPGNLESGLRQPRKLVAVRPRPSVYWQEGHRKILWLGGTIVLLLVYGGIIGYAAASNFALTKVHFSTRPFIVLGVFVLSIVPTLFWWRQTLHFDTWLRENGEILGPDTVTTEAQQFKTNSEFARLFWTALVVVFTGILIATSK
jgi:hypothetical protein